MGKSIALTGNASVSFAMKQINPDVVAAYPITPQTSIVERFSEYVANGEVDTEMILAESEHSAMSACVGAVSAGARTMTATSSQGLALMWEILYIASGLRLPMVMPVVNRSLSAPINIHCDHSDAMGARDSGWIQFFCENCQEVYDNIIQAVRVSEHPDVQLPVMVNLDGFILSHEVENVLVEDEECVRRFIGEFNPRFSLLDIGSPVTIGPLDLQDYYFEHKRQQAEGMHNSLEVIEAVAADFKKVFGRSYSFVESYRLEDADICVVGMGSTMGTLKDVVDTLRLKGIKAGVLKIRVFRPFPKRWVVDSLKHIRAIAVLDRADSFDGIGGPLYGDVRSALYGTTHASLVNYIYGLGGREITIRELESIFSDLVDVIKKGQASQEVMYLGVR